MMTPPPSDHEERETPGTIRTLLDLLTTEKMDGPDRPIPSQVGPSRWTTLKQRLRLNAIGWCGAATWRLGSRPLITEDDDNNNEADDDDDNNNEDQNDVVVVGVEEGMNLAAALAEERRLRTAEVVAEMEREDRVCCVCMGRKKGAAMIPCGHTYCRVCCREMWRHRGSCPLCNRPILDILHIY